jgi:hypothetical protein
MFAMFFVFYKVFHLEIYIFHQDLSSYIIPGLCITPTSQAGASVVPSPPDYMKLRIWHKYYVSGHYPLPYLYHFLFIFQNKRFRRLDSASVFRENLFSWAQSIDFLPITRYGARMTSNGTEFLI